MWVRYKRTGCWHHEHPKTADGGRFVWTHCLQIGGVRGQEFDAEAPEPGCPDPDSEVPLICKRCHRLADQPAEASHVHN